MSLSADSVIIETNLLASETSLRGEVKGEAILQG